MDTQPAERIDLGHGISLSWQDDPDWPKAALVLWHDAPQCGNRAGVPLNPPWSTGWTVERMDPLTLSPSILCTGCGLHGWIRDGKWVPA